LVVVSKWRERELRDDLLQAFFQGGTRSFKKDDLAHVTGFPD
jgi:hypothetical protein